MSTPSRSTKNQDPALIYAPPRVRDQTQKNQVRLSVRLCAIYWHFLLALWLVLFSILTPWVGDFAALCRGFSPPVY